MFSLALTLGAAVASTWFATPAAATSCTAFDSDFNLYAFGVKGRDFAFGPQDSWANVPTGNVMPTTGRPPFDGPNTQCFTSEYFNCIYFLNADNSQPKAVHIFDATSKTWTTQQTNMPDGLDPSSMVAILDHDTNVAFAMSKGNLYQLDMGQQKAALPTALDWGATNAPNVDLSNYTPVMGLAQNHIHFIGIPGDTEGQANIFVIHFAYWQPEVQTYGPGNGKGSFPQKHGQVASFFTGDNSAQKRFAFLPDDMSNTHIIDVEKNTTTVLPPPPASAGFATNPIGLMGRLSASPSALVYISPANELHYIAVDQNNMAAATDTKWSPISSSELVAAAAVDPSTTSAPATGSASMTATGMATSRATGTASGTAAASKPSGSSATNGAMGMNVGLGAGVAAVLVGLQAWLMF